MKILLFSFLSTILLDVGCGIGCHKNCDDLECTVGNTHTFPMEGKKFFYFKDNSYWIYKNENTNEIDSHWVTESYAGVTPDCEDEVIISENCFEYNRFKQKSILMGNEEVFLKFNNLEINFRDSFNNFIEIRRINFYDGGYLKENERGGKVNLLQQYIINNITYDSVFSVTYTLVNPKDKYTEIYYAKYIGAIRYRTINNQSWNLIKYNVIQ